MELAVLIVVIVGIIAAVVVLKLLWSTLKLVVLALGAALLVVLVTVAVMLIDLHTFSDGFSNQTTYLLDDNGELIAGFTLEGLNFSSFTPLQHYPEFIENESVHVVVKRSALNTSLPLNDSDQMSLSFALESSDYRMRASAFAFGLAQLVRSDSLFEFRRFIRNEEIALFPKPLTLQLMTINSNDYKETLLNQYQERVVSRFEVNSS